MARRREEGDIKLDFRGKDFSQMSEKGSAVHVIRRIRLNYLSYSAG